MSFRRVGGIDMGNIEYVVTAGTAVAEGECLAENGNVVQRASATSTIHTVACIAAQTISTTDALILGTPLLNGPIQLWETDCSNNTAATQLYENMILTDKLYLDNTDTDVTGPTGIFHCLAVIGAAADKKLLGFFTVLPVTST